METIQLKYRYETYNIPISRKKATCTIPLKIGTHELLVHSILESDDLPTEVTWMTSNGEMLDMIISIINENGYPKFQCVGPLPEYLRLLAVIVFELEKDSSFEKNDKYKHLRATTISRIINTIYSLLPYKYIRDKKLLVYDPPEPYYRPIRIYPREGKQYARIEIIQEDYKHNAETDIIL